MPKEAYAKRRAQCWSDVFHKNLVIALSPNPVNQPDSFPISVRTIGHKVIADQCHAYYPDREECKKGHWTRAGGCSRAGMTDYKSASWNISVDYSNAFTNKMKLIWRVWRLPAIICVFILLIAGEAVHRVLRVREPLRQSVGHPRVPGRVSRLNICI